jgi:MFS family permease
MVSLSLVLAVTSATGSYAVAGSVMALFGLASSLLSPVRAGLIDRHGPRRVLFPMAVVYALLLAGLAAATWQPGAPRELLWALAVAAGACTPPLGPVMRALWSDLLPDRALLQRAYSLDTVAEELLFIAGPLVAGLLTKLATPALGVAVSAVLVVAGTLAFVSSPVMRDMVTDRTGTDSAWRPPDGSDSGSVPGRQRHRWSPGAPGLGHPVMMSAGVGICLGALNLLVVVFAQRHQQVAAVAWVEASLAAGSAIGGLAYGALSWRVSARVRLPLLTAALSLILAAAGLSPSLHVLVAVVGAAGLCVAPALATAYLVADEAAAPDARIQAGAWVNTAFNAGSSAGTAAIGLLVGPLPLAMCFAVAAAPGLLSAMTALGRLIRPGATPMAQATGAGIPRDMPGSDSQR